MKYVIFGGYTVSNVYRPHPKARREKVTRIFFFEGTEEGFNKEPRNKNAPWRSEGSNHRIYTAQRSEHAPERNGIARDQITTAWVIDIANPSLMEEMEKAYECTIIPAGTAYYYQIPTIEIENR